MTAVRRPILLLAAIAVLASGWLLWRTLVGEPTVSAPQPAPRPVRASTWRNRRLRGGGAHEDSRAGVPRLAKGSRTAGTGPRSAGDPARGGGVGAPVPAVRGAFPAGAGEDPPPDPVVVAREQRLRASVEAVVQAVVGQGHPGVRVVFADCSAEGGTGCLARVESTSRADIDRFLDSARRSSELATLRVRERPTAMNGVVWHADLEPRFAVDP